MPEAPLYRTDRKAAHRAVRERDGDACWICGRPVPAWAEQGDPEMPTLDHIVERSRGGPDDLHNLALAHHRCNQERSRGPSRSSYARLVDAVGGLGDRLESFAAEALARRGAGPGDAPPPAAPADMSIGACPKIQRPPTPAEVLARVRAALPSLPDPAPLHALDALVAPHERTWDGSRTLSLPPADARVGRLAAVTSATVEAWLAGLVDGSPARALAECAHRTAPPDDLVDWHLSPARPGVIIGRAEIGHDSGRPGGQYRSPMSDPMRKKIADLPALNLAEIERHACAVALERGGGIVAAAELLGLTRHALKRRMIKHGLVFGPGPQPAGEQPQ